MENGGRAVPANNRSMVRWATPAELRAKAERLRTFLSTVSDPAKFTMIRILIVELEDQANAANEEDASALTTGQSARASRAGS